MRLAAAILTTFLLASSAPSRSPAQYMYMDTNGDGVHTEDDVVQPTDSTTVDIWLQSDVDRDGNPAVCGVSEVAAMTVGSYEFILQASGGTIHYGSARNLMATFTVSFGREQSITDLYMGYGGYPALPPGTYKLASVTVTPLAGTPSLRFGTSTSVYGPGNTAFGSQCPGLQDDHTIRLGSDWHDSDGARYGAASHPPQLEPIADLAVSEGEVAERVITASDPDGSFLVFSKLTGPAFLDISTTHAGPAGPTGLLRMAAGYSDAGSYSGSIAVSDGVHADSQAFGISVQDVNRAPTLSGSGGYAYRCEARILVLTARDPDGDHVGLSFAGVPAWAHFTDNGDNTATLFMAPPQTEPDGEVPVEVTVSDGTIAVASTFRIYVGECGGGVVFGGGGGVPPVARVDGPYTGFVGAPIHTDGSGSSDPDGGRLHWGWSFGDGAMALGERASHVYDRPGVYTVVLTVGDGTHTDWDSTTATVEVPVLDRVTVTPNPFHNEGSLSFYLPSTARVKARLLDAHGRKVRTLLNASMRDVGTVAIRVTARNDEGKPLASGVYFYEVEANGRTMVGRIAILK